MASPVPTRFRLFLINAAPYRSEGMPLGELANWLFGGSDDKGRTAKGPRLSAPDKPTVTVSDDAEAEIREAQKLTRDVPTRTAFAGFIRAVHALVEKRDASPPNLAALVAGLDCRHKALREGAGEQIMRLSHHFPAIERQLLGIVEGDLRERRLAVIQSIWRVTPPRDTAVTLLRKGLIDREERVRYFAVDRIRTGEFRELLPEMKELRQRETDARLRRFIDFNVGLIETGFYVEENAVTGDRVITVALGKGGLSSKSIPAAEYSPEKVKEVLEKLRSDWRRLQGKSA